MKAFAGAGNPDVLIIGGGNAALCAALMAREAGASVLLLEASPRAWRGGNSVHTRNLRCMHDAPQDVLTEAYPEEEFWQDLLKVTGGQTTERMARRVIRESSSLRSWMQQHGVRFQASLSGTLHLSRTNAFFMGGGKALVNAYYRSAEQLGVQIRYDAPVVRLELKPSTGADRAEDQARPALPVNSARSMEFVAAHLESGERIAATTLPGSARLGGKTNTANGRPTTLPFAAHATTWVCCSKTSWRRVQTPPATQRKATAWRLMPEPRCTTAVLSRGWTA
jgi:precorrin 3B synthase CobZ